MVAQNAQTSASVVDTHAVDTLMDLLTESERADLLRSTVVRRYGRNEVVFHEGDTGDALHLVERGLFVARSSDTLGHVLTVNVFRRGAVFGELALILESAVRSATVSSVSPGQTRIVRRADFDRLRERNPRVDRFLVSVLADRNRLLTTQLIELMFTPSQQRIYRQLLRLDELGIASDDTGWIVLDQEGLATLTGTTRATVNRALREAEKAGGLELRRGASRVIDRAVLQRMAS
jgi:CRP/FNR family transcriptional regulator, cyclic AMP receptor protein